MGKAKRHRRALGTRFVQNCATWNLTAFALSQASQTHDCSVPAISSHGGSVKRQLSALAQQTVYCSLPHLIICLTKGC